MHRRMHLRMWLKLGENVRLPQLPQIQSSSLVRTGQDPDCICKSERARTGDNQFDATVVQNLKTCLKNKTQRQDHMNR